MKIPPLLVSFLASFDLERPLESSAVSAISDIGKPSFAHIEPFPPPFVDETQQLEKSSFSRPVDNQLKAKVTQSKSKSPSSRIIPSRSPLTATTSRSPLTTTSRSLSSLSKGSLEGLGLNLNGLGHLVESQSKNIQKSIDNVGKNVENSAKAIEQLAHDFQDLQQILFPSRVNPRYNRPLQRAITSTQHRLVNSGVADFISPGMRMVPPPLRKPLEKEIIEKTSPLLDVLCRARTHSNPRIRKLGRDLTDKMLSLQSGGPTLVSRAVVEGLCIGRKIPLR